MKNRIPILLAPFVAALGIAAAFAATVFGHYVSKIAYACGGERVTVEQFPPGPSPVHVSVFKNGGAVFVGTLTVTADQSGHGELVVPADLTGDSLVETTVEWSVAGGGKASYADHLIAVCETKTVTVTVEKPVPGPTVTGNGASTTVTVDRAVPGPTVTVDRPNTITTPGATKTVRLPGKTVVVTKTAKPKLRTVVRTLPPKIHTVVRTVVRWKTRTVVKTVQVQPSPKALCVSTGGVWMSGHCGIQGRG